MNDEELVTDGDAVRVLCVGGPYDGTWHSIRLPVADAGGTIAPGDGGTPYRWFGQMRGETLVFEPDDGSRDY